MPLFRFLVRNADHPDPTIDKSDGDVITWVYEGHRFGLVEEGLKEGPGDFTIVVMECADEAEANSYLESETRQVVEGTGLERVVTEEVVNSRKKRIDLAALEAEPESRVEMEGKRKKLTARGTEMVRRVSKARRKRVKGGGGPKKKKKKLTEKPQPGKKKLPPKKRDGGR